MTGWTAGQPALEYQRCPSCNAVWYFARAFCPCCGNPEPQTLTSAGHGVVQAITTVTRAPSPELRALAPYRIALVDLDEGFRAMTHAADDVGIGDAVTTRFVPFAAHIIPYCERRP